MGIGQDSGIPRPIGEEKPVGIQCQRGLGGGRCRHNHDAESVAPEETENVPLHTEIIQDNQRFATTSGSDSRTAECTVGIPLVNPGGGHLTDQIQLVKGRGTSRGGNSLQGITSIGGKAGAHGTLRAKMAGQGTGIHTGNRRDSMGDQVGTEILNGSPVARNPGEFLQHKAPDLGNPAFNILGGRSIVADQRVGHGDDLATVRRIREDFLIAAHARVEADLSDRTQRSTD